MRDEGVPLQRDHTNGDNLWALRILYAERLASCRSMHASGEGYDSDPFAPRDTKR